MERFDFKNNFNRGLKFVGNKIYSIVRGTVASHATKTARVHVNGIVNIAQLERQTDGKRIFILFDLHTCSTNKTADSISVVDYLEHVFRTYAKRDEHLDVFIEMDRFVSYEEKDTEKIPDICKVRKLVQSLAKRNPYPKVRFHRCDIRVASALMHIPAIIDGYQDLIRSSSLDVDIDVGTLLSAVMWPIWISIGHTNLHLENQYIRKQYRKLSPDDKIRFDKASNEVAKRVLKFFRWYTKNIPDPLIVEAGNDKSRQHVLKYLNKVSDYASYLSVFYTDLYTIGRMLKTTLKIKAAIAYVGYAHGSHLALALQRHFGFKLVCSARPINSVNDTYEEEDRGVIVPHISV